MQKVTKILEIIGIVFCAVGFVLFLTLGIIGIIGMVAAAAQGSGSGSELPEDVAAAAAALAGAGAILMVYSFMLIPGLIITIIALKENSKEEPGRVKMIVLGALQIIFAFIPAGVLSIIRGVKEGK
jgi:hypothetical protein